MNKVYAKLNDELNRLRAQIIDTIGYHVRDNRIKVSTSHELDIHHTGTHIDRLDVADNDPHRWLVDIVGVNDSGIYFILSNKGESEVVSDEDAFCADDLIAILQAVETCL